MCIVGRRNRNARDGDVAAQGVFRRIHSASWSGGCWNGRSSEKEHREDVDGIVDGQLAVVVTVDRILAARLECAENHVLECSDGIGEIYGSVAVNISAYEVPEELLRNDRGRVELRGLGSGRRGQWSQAEYHAEERASEEFDEGMGRHGASLGVVPLSWAAGRLV